MCLDLSLNAPEVENPEQVCSYMMPYSLCRYTRHRMVTTALMVWSVVNTVWVGFLMLSQFGQICIGKTTNEMANGYRYDYFVHPADRGLPSFRRRMYNPFDHGCLGNCGDFWRGDVDWASVPETEHMVASEASKQIGASVGNMEPADFV